MFDLLTYSFFNDKKKEMPISIVQGSGVQKIFWLLRHTPRVQFNFLSSNLSANKFSKVFVELQ